jgi:hypothetical protein
MRARILFLVGLGLGYVLGTRRGRQGYIDIKDRVRSISRNPTVQKTVDTVRSAAEDKAPAAAAKVEDVADKAQQKIDESIDIAEARVDEARVDGAASTDG